MRCKAGVQQFEENFATFFFSKAVPFTMLRSGRRCATVRNSSYTATPYFYSQSSAQRVLPSRLQSTSVARYPATRLPQMHNTSMPLLHAYARNQQRCHALRPSLLSQRSMATTTITDKELRLKKLKWRARTRGMKETNLLLGTYALANADKMSNKELDQFEELLEVWREEETRNILSGGFLFQSNEVSFASSRKTILTCTIGLLEVVRHQKSISTSCYESSKSMHAMVCTMQHWMCTSKLYLEVIS